MFCGIGELSRKSKRQHVPREHVREVVNLRDHIPIPLKFFCQFFSNRIRQFWKHPSANIIRGAYCVKLLITSIVEIH